MHPKIRRADFLNKKANTLGLFLEGSKRRAAAPSESCPRIPPQLPKMTSRKQRGAERRLLEVCFFDTQECYGREVWAYRVPVVPVPELDVCLSGGDLWLACPDQKP